MCGIHQGHQDRGVYGDLIDFCDLDNNGGGIGKVGHGILDVILDEDGRDEQTDTHKHLVFDQQVVIFRRCLFNEDINGLAHDETGKEIEQKTDDEQ